MKALFITTKTSDCVNHVNAWESVFGPADRVTFNHVALRNDWFFEDKARELKPDVIFYIGACKAIGNPIPDTFTRLRNIAPLVNLCSDAADKPWHQVLETYKKHGCFDLQVSIDGARNAPVDLAVLTPTDPYMFTSDYVRNIHCGFSGTIGRHTMRDMILTPLVKTGIVEFLARKNSYTEHAYFIQHCLLTINVPMTGTGRGMHVKGRVIESGLAGCALLEMKGSPAYDWFPTDALIPYTDHNDAGPLIRDLPQDVISHHAQILSKTVRATYTPKLIYGSILDRLGLKH